MNPSGSAILVVAHARSFVVWGQIPSCVSIVLCGCFLFFRGGGGRPIKTGTANPAGRQSQCSQYRKRQFEFLGTTLILTGQLEKKRVEGRSWWRGLVWRGQRTNYACHFPGLFSSSGGGGGTLAFKKQWVAVLHGLSIALTPQISSMDFWVGWFDD